MMDHMAHLAAFVAGMRLAYLDPLPLAVTASDPQVRAWGLLGEDDGKASGFLWIQDTAQPIGQPADRQVRQSVTVVVAGLAAGTYAVRPYDTWQGVYLEESSATPGESGRLTLAVPPFRNDLAIRLEQR